MHLVWKENKLSEFTDLGSVVAERLPEWCKRDDSLIRCIAVNGIRRLNIKDSLATTTLKELLHDPDPDVRIDSAYALGELKVASSAEDLIDVITHDPVGEARIQATKALGKIAVARVVNPLVDCIRNDGYPELEVYSDETEFNSCWEVQSEAIIALGEIAGHSVVEPLIKFIDESDYDDLQDLGFRTLVKDDSVRAHQYLHQQLNKGERKAKKKVIRALADTQHNFISIGSLSKDLIVDLNRFLQDEDPDVRLNSARALAQFGPPPATGPLCRLLLDPNKTVRLRAAELLAQSMDQASVELLHDMLENSDLNLQQLIVSILGQIGNAESAQRMCELLATADGDQKQQLIKNIGLAGNSEVLPALVDFLNIEATNEFKLVVIVAIGHLLSRQNQGTDLESIAPLRQRLSAFIFNSDRMISTAALTALAKSHENPDAILLGFIQLDTVDADVDKDKTRECLNQIPVKDITTQPELLDRRQDSLQIAADNKNAADEDLLVETEQIPLDEFLNELPDNGDPASSTLASILARQGSESSTNAAPDKIVNQPSHAGATQWIPIHATRLLIAHSNLNDELIDRLLEISTCANEALLAEIIEVFSRADNPVVLPFLEQCLKKSDRETILAALHALKVLASPITDKHTIEKLLQAEDPLIRQRSLALLAATDEQLSDKLLTDAFADDDKQVCITALQSISKESFNKKCRTTLLDLLMESGGELTVPVAAVLRRVEDCEAIHWLLEKINDEDLTEFHWIFINTLTEIYSPQKFSNG